MRRKDREIASREELEIILKSSRLMTLALSGAEGPYAVPLNYGYAEGKLYCHSAMEGRKISMIGEDPRVAFSVVAEAHIIPGEKACGFTTDFCSVTGFGVARVLTDDGERERGLNVLMRGHGGPEGPYLPEVMKKTAVIEIEITAMTGKLKKSRVERQVL